MKISWRTQKPETKKKIKAKIKYKPIQQQKLNKKLHCIHPNLKNK